MCGNKKIFWMKQKIKLSNVTHVCCWCSRMVGNRSGDDDSLAVTSWVQVLQRRRQTKSIRAHMFMQTFHVHVNTCRMLHDFLNLHTCMEHHNSKDFSFAVLPRALEPWIPIGTKAMTRDFSIACRRYPSVCPSGIRVIVTTRPLEPHFHGWALTQWSARCRPSATWSRRRTRPTPYHRCAPCPHSGLRGTRTYRNSHSSTSSCSTGMPTETSSTRSRTMRWTWSTMATSPQSTAIRALWPSTSSRPRTWWTPLEVCTEATWHFVQTIRSFSNVLKRIEIILAGSWNGLPVKIPPWPALSIFCFDQKILHRREPDILAATQWLWSTFIAIRWYSSNDRPLQGHLLLFLA